jgi:hypothetical protein
MCCVGQVQHQQLHNVPPPAAVQPNDKHRKLWEKLGLDGALYDNNVPFAEFLFETKLLFSIVGYQETMGAPASEGINIVDGQPCIMIQGEWRNFDWIQANLEYDDVQEWVHTKGYPDQIYTYISPRLGGFVMQSRHYYQNAFPVHQLTLEEMAALRKHAGAGEQDAIYQLVSTPRPSFSDWVVPVHISERVITSDGMVYSFGGQPHPDLAAFIAPPGSSGCAQFCKGASTGKGVVAMSDYEEFRPFDGGERLVTSAPMTGERAREVLEAIDQYKQHDQVRFNMLHQNCAKVGTEITRQAIGVDIDNRVTLGQIISNIFPDIPVITTAWKTIKAVTGKFWNCFPEFMRMPFEILAEIVFYIPNKLATFLTNLVVVILGGCRQADNLRPVHDNPNNQQGMTQFSRLVRNFTDLFRDHPSDVYHHMPVIEWQRQQKTTVAYQYDKPRMYMLPPPEALPAGAVVA